ncbi:MAG: homocysteine S-methyltransferase family protein, partial [Candidatus Eisenbacteria bacterium]
ALKLAGEALEKSLDPLKVIEGGFACGLSEAGKRWERGEYFLPELMMASEAMKAAMSELKPRLDREKLSVRSLGKAVIGTVEGDIHDIGKSLVAKTCDRMTRPLWFDIPKERSRLPIIFDGAVGSLLMAAGLRPGAMPDLCSIERPDLVGDMHGHYVRAGADVIQTNTFGSNRVRLSQAEKGSGGSAANDGPGWRPVSVETLNRSAARIAIEAATGQSLTDLAGGGAAGGGREGETRRNRVLVAGNIGPSGKLLKPLGDLSPEALSEAYVEQAHYLADSGVDFISIETMFSLEEALIALKAAKEACGLPVSVSMTFQKTKNGFFTVMGERPAPSLEKLLSRGADMVGANCTLGSAEMKELADALLATIKGPVLIEPNAGQPIARDAGVEYPETPEFFAANLAPLSGLGVSAIGGCCGTTPEHISALRRAVYGKAAGNAA